MLNGSPYRVTITANKGINIILSNRSIVHERTYSHFISAEDGAFFMDTIRQLMEVPVRTTLDRCVICGKHFLKKDRLCLLKNGAVCHKACFLREERNKRLDYDELDKSLCPSFPADEPEFEFSNLDGPDNGFRFAVQIVSDTVIHLYCRAYSDGKHHFVLTKGECQELAGEIERQLQAVRDAETGVCFHCGGKIYIDEMRYEMRSGELVHARCMDRFVQSESSARVTLPASKIRLVDRFSHALYFPKKYNRPAFEVSQP